MVQKPLFLSDFSCLIFKDKMSLYTETKMCQFPLRILEQFGTENYT